MESKRPIRILRIIARLNVGGPAIHVSLLTEAFSPPEYESTLVCGVIDPTEGDMAYYAHERGIEPIIVPTLGRPLNLLADAQSVWRLFWLMRRLRPDIVHTHTAKAGFVGRVAARLAGVPVVVHTFHGHVFKGYFSRMNTLVFLYLERVAARMSDSVITLTQGLRRQLAEDYRIASAGKIIVLPLGLDIEHFTTTPRQQGDFRRQWGIAPDAPLIGIVGRLVPVKNHGLFLEAAAKVLQALPSARFAIIGDGESRDEIEAQVDALGLREATVFTGWERELAPAYSDMDVLVISSINEGTPVSVIEALAAGCAVVTTEVGGLPDLLDGGKLGRLVPFGDADALAAAVIETVRQPPDGEPVRALMLERYGIRRLVSDLDSLYRGLLAKKRRGR